MKTYDAKPVKPSDDTIYKVLLADDYPIVRLGLKEIIGRMDKNARLEEAAGGEAIIALLKAEPYDLVILDIDMRRTESFSLITYLRREFPSLKLLIHTANDELIFGARFLRAGVYGYLSKQADAREIIAAYETVKSGKPFLSPSLYLHMSGLNPAGSRTMPFESLTDRELEVTLQILRGYTTHEIARILNLNRSTVATHKHRIMKKLKLDDQMALMRLAKEYGIC